MHVWCAPTLRAHHSYVPIFFNCFLFKHFTTLWKTFLLPFFFTFDALQRPIHVSLFCHLFALMAPYLRKSTTNSYLIFIGLFVLPSYTLFFLPHLLVVIASHLSLPRSPHSYLVAQSLCNRLLSYTSLPFSRLSLPDTLTNILGISYGYYLIIYLLYPGHLLAPVIFFFSFLLRHGYVASNTIRSCLSTALRTLLHSGCRY